MDGELRLFQEQCAVVDGRELVGVQAPLGRHLVDHGGLGGGVGVQHLDDLGLGHDSLLTVGGGVTRAPTGLRTRRTRPWMRRRRASGAYSQRASARGAGRSEEHTSELQSHHDLVCRLLLEKKKKKKNKNKKIQKNKKQK